MNTIFMPLQTAVSEAGVLPTGGKVCVLAASIALAVSSSMSLPTTEVENPSEHYLTQVQEGARGLICQFNENLVFDLQAALTYARQFWLLRYTAAHPLQQPVYALQYGFFDTLCGVGLHVPAELHDGLNEHKAKVFTLASAARAVVAGLQTSEIGG